MKIDRIFSTQIDKIYNNKKKDIGEVNKTKSKDAFEISKEAKNISAITSDSFLDSDKKASEVKAKVDAGTYTVNTKALVIKFKEIMKGREV